MAQFVDQRTPPGGSAGPSETPVPGYRRVEVTGLAAGALGGWGVFAQGLAAAAPSVALAVVPFGLFTAAGKGSVWAATIGFVLVLLIAGTLTFQSRRTVSSGSLGTYAANGLGSGAGFAAGWSLIVAYVSFAVTAVLGATLYLNSFLSDVGLPAAVVDSTPFKLLLVLIVSAVASYIPFRGVALAAKLELILESVAIATILIIIVASYVSYGPHIDLAQLNPAHLGESSTYVAAVYAVASYAGFESVAALGGEARNAHRNISRSLLAVVVILGFLYTVSTYPQVLQFGDIDTDKAILPAIADSARVSWIKPYVSAAVAVSYTVFAIALITSVSRSLLTLSDEGALPKALGKVHPRFNTPAVAVFSVGAISLVLSVIATLSTAGRLIFDVYVGYVATWGFITAYLLAVIATPIWLHRIKALTPFRAVVTALALVGLVLIIINNFFPIPSFPYNILPEVFLVLLAAGLIRYWYLRARKPEVARQIGSIQTFSEEVQDRLTGSASASQR